MNNTLKLIHLPQIRWNRMRSSSLVAPKDVADYISFSGVEDEEHGAGTSGPRNEMETCEVLFGLAQYLSMTPYI
jgi:hypothetical protein